MEIERKLPDVCHDSLEMHLQVVGDLLPVHNWYWQLMRKTPNNNGDLVSNTYRIAEISWEIPEQKCPFGLPCLQKNLPADEKQG